MSNNRYINIRYPFKPSDKGLFIDLTQTTIDAVKSDLQHLLLTEKGERLYLPDFGTNLKKFLFEPNDSINQINVINDIKTTTSKYIPGLTVTDVKFTMDEDEENFLGVTVSFKIGEGIFTSSDFVEIKL